MYLYLCITFQINHFCNIRWKKDNSLYRFIISVLYNKFLTTLLSASIFFFLFLIRNEKIRYVDDKNNKGTIGG